MRRDPDEDIYIINNQRQLKQIAGFFDNTGMLNGKVIVPSTNAPVVRSFEIMFLAISALYGAIMPADQQHEAESGKKTPLAFYSRFNALMEAGRLLVSLYNSQNGNQHQD